jgi:hypothetical protein
MQSGNVFRTFGPNIVKWHQIGMCYLNAYPIHKNQLDWDMISQGIPNQNMS